MARILVVDDDEGVRTFLAEALEADGHDVQQASDGAAAIRRLEAESFHVLVTDLRMPVMDGMALVRRARAEQPELEIVVLTAHGTIETAIEAMKLGAFDYLQKPVEGPAELRLVVARAVERRVLRARSRRGRRARRPPCRRRSRPAAGRSRRCARPCAGLPPRASSPGRPR